MNLRVAILVASLVANVALATFIAIQHTPDALRPQQTVADKSESVPASEGQPSDGNASAEPTTQTEGARGFHWSHLESQDYKEYVSRLRNFGVPEKTIRDIIIADVQKLYRPRFAALRPPKKPTNPNFWENRNQSYNPNREQTKQQREQTRALQKEQTELIKTLLGADVYDQMSKESGYPDWTERAYGPLSKEDRERITEMRERFQEAQSEIYAKANNYIDQDTQAELAALRRKHRNELAAVLSPEQLEEYELRSSEIAQRMKWELASFDPNEKEFRAIHSVKQAQEDLEALLRPDVENSESTRAQIKALQEKQAALKKSLTDMLGTNRAREFQLAEQWEYRNLLESGVSRENVFKLADIREEVESAARKLRQDKSLSTEQRSEALQGIKAETETVLTEMLGERRAKYYSSSSGWLRNLAPSP